MKRLEVSKRNYRRALEARAESSRTFSARLKTDTLIQRLHLWLPSMRISDAYQRTSDAYQRTSDAQQRTST